MRMSEYPNITVRVVPNGGYHVGAVGAFVLFERPDSSPVVFVENLASSLFLEEEHEVDLHRHALRILLDTALDERQSRELIATVATNLTREASPVDADQWKQPDMA